MMFVLHAMPSEAQMHPGVELQFDENIGSRDLYRRLWNHYRGENLARNHHCSCYGMIEFVVGDMTVAVMTSISAPTEEVETTMAARRNAQHGLNMEQQRPAPK